MRRHTAINVAAPLAAASRHLASAAALFDHALYRATRQPLAQARTLPGHVYGSEAWHAAEVQHLFGPSWMLAGRADELPDPGSFLRFDLPDGTSALIVRGRDDQIRAWANVCTHRGAALTRATSGRFKGGITCPYHAWTFDHTHGKLRGVPKGGEMPGCFSKDEWPLLEVRLVNYRGFLFVTGSDTAPPFETLLGNAGELALADWPLEDFVTVGRREYVVDCNWKFIMQNTSETYHTSFVHRDSLGPMPSEPIGEFVGIQPRGQWDAVHVPGDRSIVPLPGEAAPFPELSTRASTYFISLFPCLQINVTRDCAWWMRILPDGPRRSHVTMGFLFPRDTAAMPNFDELLQPYLYRWDLAVREDNDISCNQQKASESPHHRPGPYHSLEFAVHRFDNMVLDAVLTGAALDDKIETAATTYKGKLASPPFKMGVSVPRMQQQQTRSMHQAPAVPFALAPGSTVCVTGASGFIALHLVEQLLTAGYRVVAAVRTDSPTKLAPLKALDALGELKIVPGCDLLVPDSFAPAVAEADVCFHTASPFWMDSRISDPWAQLVQPAEAGTVNVLNSCAQLDSKVRRVVLTSSFAALMNVGGRAPWPMDFEYHEGHWNVASAPDESGAFPEPVNAHAYRWSKTVAEQAAWAHPGVAEGKFDLVTILPPMVLGENKQALGSSDDLNQSSLILYNLLVGKMEHVMPGSVGFVDVADVANAHVRGAQTGAAGGQRYLCSGVTKTWLEIVEILRTLYPTAPLPSTCADGSTTQPCLLLKNDKIRTELGLEFVALETTLKEQCSALEKAGLLEF